jgi:hypothetical protein
MKPTRCTNFSNLCLERDSTCFGQFLCPVWLIQLLCVQWRTPDDGQRNCPKHVEFLSKNKFEKLVHLLGFIIRNLTQCTVMWTLYCVYIKCFYTLRAFRLLLISRWDLYSFGMSWSDNSNSLLISGDNLLVPSSSFKKSKKKKLYSWSCLQGSRNPRRTISWPMKMGPIGCPETMVRNYHYVLCDIPEDCRSYLYITYIWGLHL